jgi:type VI secretion system protein
MTRTHAGLLAAAAAAALSLFCASPAGTRLQLHVTVAPDVNDDRPIPVDVVFVWDKAAAAKFDALTAKDWFDKKDAFRRDDPQERAFTIRDWEWVPGQEVPEIDLTIHAASRRWLRAVYVFANYRTEGSHRARLGPGAATVALLRNDLQVEQAGHAAKAPTASGQHE